MTAYTHSGTGTTLTGASSGPYTVGNVTFAGGRTLRNVGTLAQIAGTDALDLVTNAAGAGRFVNEGIFNVTTGGIRGRGFAAEVPADVMRNFGTINKTGAGNYSIGAPLDHAGTLNIAEGTLMLTANAVLRSGSTAGGPGAAVYQWHGAHSREHGTAQCGERAYGRQRCSFRLQR